MILSDPDLADYWPNFIGQIDKRYWIAVLPCVDVYNEAYRCYKAKVYLATCILCRDSVEAILYRAKIIVNFGEGVIDRVSYGPDKDDYPSFTKLFNWAKCEHLLDGLESKVECIKKDGDFGAHLLQKIDQAFAEILPKPPETEKDFGYGSGPAIQIWISPETARQRILDTAEVILQVIHKKWS
jgi:hypothetical protein